MNDFTWPQDEWMLGRSGVNSGSEAGDEAPFQVYSVHNSTFGHSETAQFCRVYPVYPKGFERWIVRIADLSLEDCASNLR